MCYSVMVETDLRKLEHDFRAEVDVEGFLRILRERKEGRKNLKVARGLERYFMSPKTAQETACRDLIAEYTDEEIQRFQKKAFAKRQVIADCEEKLAKRWSKTNQLKLETAQRVLEKALYDIARLQGPYIPTDSAIFQYYYAPLIVKEGSAKKIKFFRYQVRPRWAKTEPNRQINMFNARLDMLEERKTWSPLFMKQHAVLIFKSFFEWVEHPETKKNAIIQFTPGDDSLMWAPALFEHWQALDRTEAIDSFAILTRDPPPEVAAMGHDRCPIFPEWNVMEAWLAPQETTKHDMKENLERLSSVCFKHDWAA